MKKLPIILCVLFSIFSLSACDVNEGGPEELGENIEETVEDVGNDIEDACEEAKASMKANDTDC